MASSVPTSRPPINVTVSLDLSLAGILTRLQDLAQQAQQRGEAVAADVQQIHDVSEALKGVVARVGENVLLRPLQQEPPK
jgi:hypothetical protein